VMKQAAEVLQEALKGAGGSMEELSGEIPAKAEPPRAETASARETEGERVSGQERSLDEAWGEEVPAPAEKPAAEAEKAIAEPSAAREEDKPKPAAEKPKPAVAEATPAREPKREAAPVSERRPAAAIPFEEPERAKGSG